MEEKIRLLEKELKYLKKEIIQEEIQKNKEKLKENISVKKIADDIYNSRGLDIDKLNRNITNNLINDLKFAFSEFKNKKTNIKIKMIVDLLFMVLILILFKIPFDLIRDIGYEYIEIISSNELYFIIWNLLFLVIYTVLILCAGFVLIKNFTKKYK